MHEGSMMIEATATQFKFQGTLTTSDSKTYHPHSFEVPEGTTNIHVDFQFTPLYASGRIHRNQINVSLNDPDGIRGVWNVIREEGFDVNAAASSRGFGSWDIQPGLWTAYVDVHRILSPDPVIYELTATLSTEPLPLTPSAYDDTRRAASTEPGWYRGDLHGHTVHSDGSWDIPEFTQFMRGLGLDFVSLSDHNTVTGLAQHRSQTEDGFLALGGMELSTFNGHMLALGGNHWYEWRLNIEEGMDIDRIMQQVIDRGELLIIAHPMSPDEPFCSGCMWQFEEARPGAALGVEVWNGYWHVFNEDGLQQYYAWLNQGHRLVATSGTDIHRPFTPDADQRRGFNVVYAEELSEAAILAAIRKGHSYISAGPELLLNARSESGVEGMMGDALPTGAATISARWNRVPESAALRLIVDGEVHSEQPVSGSGEAGWDLSAGERKWCSLELRDAKHVPWALTNPIFFE
jgi:hypothetical protein